MKIVRRILLIALVLAVAGYVSGTHDWKVSGVQAWENGLSQILLNVSPPIEQIQAGFEPRVMSFRAVGSDTIQGVQGLTSLLSLGVADAGAHLRANLSPSPLNEAFSSIGEVFSGTFECWPFLLENWWTVRVLTIHDLESFQLAGQTFELTGC